VLQLGGEARMNMPGRLGGNWAWRMREDQLKAAPMDWLAELTGRYSR
jgi:4-alpha-glucanotransferase